MSTLIVKTENAAAAKLLMAFLKTVRLVKSITLSSDEGKTNVLNEPAGEYNWINPARPATEEEIEQMLDECENDTGEYSSEEVMKGVKDRLSEWRKNKK